MPKLKKISTWEELEGLESDTHRLEIDLDMGSGEILRKSDNEDEAYQDYYYLSTHTFYGSQYKQSNNALQRRGFNIELESWD